MSPEIADIQEQTCTDAPKIVHTIINNGEKFPITEHLRNLPPTWTPSVKQRELAESLGITFGEHQTFVSSLKTVHKRLSSLHLSAIISNGVLVSSGTPLLLPFN